MYAGNVGTGFTDGEIDNLLRKLRPLDRKEPPFEAVPKMPKIRKDAIVWVEPKLVAEIAYTEWTSDGRLRHPVFRGLREDKPAAEIVEERPLPTPTQRPAKNRVKLSNPDKVLFPDPGITKRQLADYWAAVADVALPLLAARLTPEGVLNRLDAVLGCREALELNVKPRIAVEAMTVALRLT